VAEYRAVVPVGPCLEAAAHPEAARGIPAAGTGRAVLRIRAVADPTAGEAAAAVGRCEGRSWPHERDTDPLPMTRAGRPRRVTSRASRRSGDASTSSRS